MASDTQKAIIWVAILEFGFRQYVGKALPTSANPPDFQNNPLFYLLQRVFLTTEGHGIKQKYWISFSNLSY